MSRMQAELANQDLLHNSRSQSRLRVTEVKKRKASNSFDQSSCKIETLDQIHQREIHKHQLTIARLHQKIKKIVHQSEQFQSKSKQLQLSLDFYKIKLQEECQRNRHYEQGIDTISATISVQLNILKRMLDQNQQPSLISVDEKSNEVEITDPILKALRLIKRLQIEHDRLQISMLAKKREPADVQRLYKSMNATLQLTKSKYERQRQLLKKEISDLTTRYEEKVAENQDYRIEISNLLKQRAYTGELLICSEKEKISIVNDIYQIAKTELNNKLQNMAKPDLILLCLQLFARLKDVEADRRDAQTLISKLEAESTTKYSALLREVRSIERSPKKQPTRLRKMKSMPAE